MSRRIRSSKYRHVFTEGPKPATTWNNITISDASGDHQAIKCNSKYVATGVKGGGGPFIVIPLDRAGGPIMGDLPRLNGHTSDVTDIDFHPFNQSLLVSGSIDAKLCVWKIPDGGLTESIDPVATIKGCKKKVLYTTFNPVSENILATADGGRQINIWDIERSTPVINIDKAHPKLIQDLKWSYDGSMLATCAKDKTIRLFDPRAGVEAGTVLKNAVLGLKTFKMCFLHNKSQYCVAGFDRNANRILKTFDHRTHKVLTQGRIDQGAGFIMPFYDEGTNLMYLAGKGDSNIRIYERTDKNPYLYECSNPRVSSACKGMCMAPKRILNILDCETTRFYKLVAGGIETVSFTIPRRDEGFQDDLFPDDFAGVAGQNAEAYFAGSNEMRVLTSMDPEKLAVTNAASAGGDGAVFKPKAAKAVGELEGELRTLNLKIKDLEKQKLKLLGKVAKKKAKGGTTKAKAPEIDMSSNIVADEGDNWDDKEEVEVAPAPAPTPAPAPAPAPAPSVVPPPVPEEDPEHDQEALRQLRLVMGDAVVDSLPPEALKGLLGRFQKQ